MQRFKVVVLVAFLATTGLSVAGADAGFAAVSRCPKYKPGHNLWVRDKTIKIVKDSSTASKPMTFQLQTGTGAGLTSDVPSEEKGWTSHERTLLQVDTKYRQAKLYVRVEFLPGLDYDIYLLGTGGSLVAYAGGFNQAPIPGTPADGTGNGGHSELTAEQLDGILTNDCGGYTLDVASAVTPGGAVTVKYWLAKA